MPDDNERMREQAATLSHLLSLTCELLDTLLYSASPQMPGVAAQLVVERMKTYLIVRGETPPSSAEAPWVNKMRRTVDLYSQQAERAALPPGAKEDPFKLD